MKEVGFDTARTKEWLRLSSITGGTQILIQGIGLLSGIIVIRLLPTTEYALYTLANTMLGTMVVLADSGIGSGVMAESGKVWKDKERLGVALATGLDLRRKFAAGSLLIAAPILIYLLHYHGADWWMSVLIVISLIPAFISSLSGSIFQIPLKLKQDIAPLQKNTLFEGLGRFAMVFSLFVLPWTFIAILGAGIPRLITNIRLRKLSAGYADWTQKPDVEVRKRILKMVKRLMPGAVYFVVSGQISIWLISIFGTTASVAKIGALGRITIMLTVISTIFGTLVYPRFARLPLNSKILMKRFLQVMALLVLTAVMVTVAVGIFSDQILWVLGENYQNLNIELVMSIAASSIALISGAAFTMSTQRGWAIHPGISIPVNVASIILGVLLVDVSTLRGVLLFNIFIVVMRVLMSVSYAIIKIIQNNKYRLSVKDK
ncbi:polysaccharide biosynthesis protein [Cryomorpha ignava]|uniref:Polysaccharide biosynthesis protein n=2 Tax=Cryomorpha ignava TaxID=101383 RepID=A0A7K3WKR6_9FLAO|nr:polysaccharide biosynthesis protein [Cryomorpha ignava]